METEFKIAKIIDEYNVVINAGSAHNIEINDRFHILDASTNQVFDPVTGFPIGSLDLVKGTVTVTVVYELMCICTAPYEDLIATNLMAGIKGLDHLTKQKRLNIDLSEITGGLGESDEPIRVGDTVRLIKNS